MVPVGCARRLQLFLLAAGGVILGISLGAPMTFLKPVTVWRDIVASIAAAIAFSELVNWAQRGAHRWLRVGITLALLGGCVVSPGYSSFQLARRRMAHQDSRIQAIPWLQQHAGKEKTVLAIRELMILPTEWKRIAASSTVIPWFEAMELLQRQRFDYIVTGEFDLRYASDPNAWAAYRDRWQKRLAAILPGRLFGQIATPVVPYLWRTNDEHILILGGSMPR